MNKNRKIGNLFPLNKNKIIKLNKKIKITKKIFIF